MDYDLRNAHPIELASDGRTPIDRSATGRRGLLIVGRELLARDRAGRLNRRTLNITERRALVAAQDEELARPPR